LEKSGAAHEMNHNEIPGENGRWTARLEGDKTNADGGTPLIKREGM